VVRHRFETFRFLRSRRTVKRDFEFLRDSLNAPLEYDREHKGYFYRLPDYQLPLVRVTEGELVALFLATQLLQQYGGTPFERDVRATFVKIGDWLRDEVSLNLSNLGQSLSTRPAAVTPQDLKIFRTLAEAVRRQRSLRLVYWTASRDDITERTVDPYHLALVGDTWYLIGYCHLRRAILMFATARVRSARQTGASFIRPADFQIDSYLLGSFRALRGSGRHSVLLHFNRRVAGRVKERIWHQSQKLELASGGGLLVRFEVSDLREVLAWALSWGADCEVLEPPEFRELMKREVSKMGMPYRE
jgi:proteasome accessory factor B